MEVHGYTADGSIDASINGTRLTVPNNMANRHRRDIAEWEAGGNTIPPYAPPPPSPAPAVPVLCCLANLSVDAGYVGGIETAVGLGLAFMIAPNVILVFFSEAMESINYGWNVGSTSGSARVSDRQVEYFEVTIDGATEPYSLSLQIYKVQS